MPTGTPDSSNVRVAPTGAWYVAPLGTTGPTSASDALNAAFTNLGYLSEDGTSRTTDRSSNDIKGWQNAALVRTVVTDAAISYKFTLIETNRASVALYFGVAPGPDGSYDVDPSQTGGRQSFVFDVIDGTNVRRVWLPAAEVVELEDITFDSGDATGYGVTVKGYANATLSGKVERVFDPSLNKKSAAAPGNVFPADSNITASDSTNAAKLAGLGYVANPTTAWTTGQKISIGAFDFNWSGTAWAAGAHA
ncbi:hypothetical protein IT072_02375 [Leifsonia sp. ZF2019]|uniref:phage tail tube protein n=1 Tax=Leifsonia sp. ZF2019 TaxID=2781978 RepID=UPI001CBDF08A|nr:hypothetical protein [Leifsonia sp. ZF2019]UAJ78313.1 hypothetical protein IT072_13700 [Leifsonia sp. ZF2019]UAJ79943.1 hypothetical protein IT072_02375 [Leifsonia sp. ZF2019]